MKQITILNPNMTTVEQNRLGLSHFGLLSRLFTLELASRVHQEEGLWQALALELLEDGENEEQPPAAPEIQLNLDLKILTRALREELARQQEKKEPEKKEKKEPEKKEPEKKPAALTVEQRVLERILLRERELWKADGRALPRTVPGMGMSPGGMNAAALLLRERYLLLKERRALPQQTVDTKSSQHPRADREALQLNGQPQTPQGSRQSPVPSAAEEAWLSGLLGVGSADGYHVSRSRFPIGGAFDRQASALYSSGIAPRLHGDGAALPPISDIGDTAGDAFGLRAALRQYALPADLFYPNNESGESRAETPGKESLAQPARSPRQSAAIPAKTAQDELRVLRRRSATEEAADAAAQNLTPKRLRQPETAAQTISTLARFRTQREPKPTQGDARRPMPGAAAEAAALPGVAETMPGARTELILASQTTTSPAGEGWTPQWRSEHPGYTAKTPEQTNAPGGSILFPDLLRYRREQAMSGNTAREENRVPAALSAVLKDAADRERTIRAALEKLPDDRRAREQAARREATQENTQRIALQRQEKQQAEQKGALSGTLADAQTALEGAAAELEYIAQEQADRQAAEPPTEKEQTAETAQTARGVGFAEAAEEAEQERTARAVPVSDSAAPTLSAAAAELEYKAREQADRQAAEPPTEKKQTAETAQTARGVGSAEAAEEAEQERTAQAVPVSDSAAPTLSAAAAELEYKAREQADRQAAEPPTEKAQTQTGETARTARGAGHAEPSTEAEQERTARAVPVSDSAAAALSAEAAELAYKTQEQADRQAAEPPTEKKQTVETARTARGVGSAEAAEEAEQERTAQAVPVSDSAAATQTAAAAELEYKAREQADRQAAEPPTEKKQTVETAQTARGVGSAEATAEAEQEQTAQAVPVSDSAAATLSAEAAELEYKAREQADRQAAEPPTEKKQTVETARTARGVGSAEAAEEAEQERTVQAVPVSDFAAPTQTAELEYKAREQADRQAAEPPTEKKQTAETAQTARGAGHAESSTEAEQEQTARAVPVANSTAVHEISPVLRMQEQSDTPHDSFDMRRPADPVSVRRPPMAKAARQLPREPKTDRTGEPERTILSPVPDQQAPALWDTGVELTYTQQLRTPQEAAAGDSGEASAEHQTKSAFASELPSWARAVLQQNGGQFPPSGAQRDSFDSRKSGPLNGRINWSAPYAIPPDALSSAKGKTSSDAGPAPMVFHAVNEAEQEQTPRSRESDEQTARKMADKVYKIIEERLRKELRRGGK